MGNSAITGRARSGAMLPGSQWIRSNTRTLLPGPPGRMATPRRLNEFVPRHPAMIRANWASSHMPAFEKPAGSPGRRNDSFAECLPPAISDITFQTPAPDAPMSVTAKVTDTLGAQTVTLLWSVASTGNAGIEKELAMRRTSGDEREGMYEATVPESNRTGRWCVFESKPPISREAVLLPGSMSRCQPTRYCTLANTNTARIAFAFVINVSRPPMQNRTRLWNGRADQAQVAPMRGDGAFIYVPLAGGEVLTFAPRLLAAPERGPESAL